MVTVLGRGWVLAVHTEDALVVAVSMVVLPLLTVVAECAYVCEAAIEAADSGAVWRRLGGVAMSVSFMSDLIRVCGGEEIPSTQSDGGKRQ